MCRVLQIVQLLLVSACFSASPDRALAAAPPNPALPEELTIDEAATSGRPLIVKLRLEDGEELPIMIDTGSISTVLDKSLEPKLGRRLGTGHIPFPFDTTTGTQGVYQAPKLFAGNIALLTGPRIITMELHCPSNHLYKGILGVDCLRQYCIQFDFQSRRMRFLQPDNLNTNTLGRPYPIITKNEGIALVAANLFGDATMQLVLDTGFSGPFDAMLAPKVFRRLMDERKAAGPTFAMSVRDGRSALAASFPKVELCGLTYTDLNFSSVDLRPKRIKALFGLRFVARHIATFNFPKRTLYLKPISQDAPPNG